MRVVDQAIRDGVGVGGIADKVVPLVDGQLACDDERLSPGTLLQEFQKVMAGAGGGFLEEDLEDCGLRRVDAESRLDLAWRCRSPAPGLGGPSVHGRAQDRVGKVLLAAADGGTLRQARRPDD